MVQIENLDGLSHDEILALAAAAERHSEPPIGRAIVAAAEKEACEVPSSSDFTAVTGAGVDARVNGRGVLVGTTRLPTTRGNSVTQAEPLLAVHEEKGHTAVRIAVDGRVSGVLSIADAIKSDANEAVAEMKARGLIPLMVTGDNHRTAAAVAREVEIEEVHAEVLPQDKANLVRKLQGEGARVIMVGDGINDAPALMQADVGAAIGAGTILDARSIGAARRKEITVSFDPETAMHKKLGLMISEIGYVGA